MIDKIRIYTILPCSYANGPGARAVIWVQGCSLNCPGCYNPETHSTDGGSLISIDELYSQIVSLTKIEGITISGGEPLEQAAALGEFLKKIRASTKLSLILFTGYEWREIESIISNNGSTGKNRLSRDSNAVKLILDTVDVVIAGRFILSKRLRKNLRGSSNKTFHFLTPRYSMKDFENIPESEIVITSSGELVISGINPLNIKI